jgi:hypothetical protein
MGQGAVGLAICAAGVPTAEMACMVDPGKFILEGGDANLLIKLACQKSYTMHLQFLNEY